MKLLKFYATVIDDESVELQVTREDDLKANVYRKTVRCKLDDVMMNVHSLEGSWYLVLQRGKMINV